MTLIILKNIGQLFCRISLLLDLSSVSSKLDSVIHFWQRHKYIISGGMMSNYLIIGDINVDYLGKVASLRFFPLGYYFLLCN